MENGSRLIRKRNIRVNLMFLEMCSKEYLIGRGQKLIQDLC